TVSYCQKNNPAQVHAASSSSSTETPTHTHCLVLDLSSVNFMDSVAMMAFCKVVGNLEVQGIRVYLAASPERVISQLQTQGCIPDSLPSSCLFPSVHHAVQRYLSTLPRPLEEINSNTSEC
ncbi:solute carrier family 26 member 6-like isoform X1, partial [Lates japonicus]